MKKLLSLLLLTSSNAFAGSPPLTNGMLAYGPIQPQAVPALSEWMLIALALLIFTAVFLTMKKKASGTPMSFFIAIIAAGIVAGGGNQLISDAYAMGPTPLNNPNGENNIVIQANMLNEFQNTTTINQEIKLITFPPSCPSVDFRVYISSNVCTEGLVLTSAMPGRPAIDTSICHIDCRPILDPF